MGSLLRPQALREAHRAWLQGGIPRSALRDAQDRAIREVVRLQEELGFFVVTDGELRRDSYWAHFVSAVDGLTVRPARFRFHDAEGGEREFLAPHVSGPVARTASVSGHELDFLSSVTRRNPKVTLPSPTTLHFWRGREGIDPGAYKSEEQFYDDLARVYRQEIEDLAARGARYVQLDDVPLAMLCDPRVRRRLTTQGEDPQRLLDRYFSLIRASLPDSLSEVTFAMHLCRGNYRGAWLAEGSYDPIAERLFSELDVDVFLLEYDSPRAGDFTPLRHVPEDRGVVLGLVSTKTPVLEDADELCRLIEEAGQYVSQDRLALSPQCGFASTAGGNPLSQDDQRRKLARVVEVAARVWGE